MQNLFSNDRMIVKGRIFKTTSITIQEELVDMEMLDLLFIFQVNGKLTQYTANLELCNGQEFELGDKLTLRNWNEWYNIEGLFSSMGYKLNPEGTDDYMRFNSPLSKWIVQLENRPVKGS